MKKNQIGGIRVGLAGVVLFLTAIFLGLLWKGNHKSLDQAPKVIESVTQLATPEEEGNSGLAMADIELEALAAENNTLRQQVDTLTLEIKTLQDELLGVQGAAPEDSSEGLRAQLADLAQQVASLRAANQSLEQQLEVSALQAQRVEDDLAKNAAAELEQAHAQERVSLNTKIEMLSEKLGDLEAQNQSLREGSAALENQSQDLSIALEQALQRKSNEDQVADQVLAQRAELATVRDQIKVLEQNEAKLIQAHQDEIDRFRDWLNKLDRDGELTTADSSVLGSELQTANERILALKRASVQREARTAELRSKLDSSLVKVGLADGLTQEVGDLIAFPLSSQLLFNSGSANLTPTGKKILTDLGQVLAEFSEFDIVVEGHTDNEAIIGGRTTNWELSSERAVAAVREIEALGGVESSRLRAVGFGEHRPVASNQTTEGRAQNRRVELRIQARP